jgi:hypothetical protein
MIYALRCPIISYLLAILLRCPNLSAVPELEQDLFRSFG